MYRNNVNEHLKKTKSNITQLQYWVLFEIKLHPTTLNEVAKQLDMRAPSLLPAIDALEKSGYLKRKKDLNDRRKTHLTLTSSGLNIATKLASYNKEDALQCAFNGLTAHKQKQLLHILQELITHMSHLV